MIYNAGVPEPANETSLRNRIEKALERDQPLELEQLVIELALESEDRIWAECTCAQLARHSSASDIWRGVSAPSTAVACTGW